MEVLKVIQDGCKGMLLDMFGTFVHPLEQELGIKSHHRVGRFRREPQQGIHRPHRSHQLQPGHDDGQTQPRPGRCRRDPGGREPQRQNPTSLYLAMQCGLKAANYPLIPEDFERRQLPPPWCRFAARSLA